ncbi:FAD-dependent oxidoreductase [Mycobacterium sp.]|uniref:FAD-dependent oxidoreductase n=1 Tax=Mycobacterium sp. TaxID=1785 RepID=UPI003D1006F5
MVLGAGMAGLFATRVLSEFYDSVTVVERDTLPDHQDHRRGVPQDRHLHALLGRGVQVLSELFPGVLDEMDAAGAVIVRDGDLSRLYARMGDWELARSGRIADPTALTLCLASRPFMEFHLRRRAMALPNVTFLDDHDLLEMLANADAVTGVRIVHRSSELTTALDADLVVDATGRATRTPVFLERLGYGRPAEERCPTPVGYSSQRFVISDGGIDQQLVISNRGSRHPSVLLSACEHNTWMLAVGRSIESGGAPEGFAEMLALAGEVLPRTISEQLYAALPLGDIVKFRNPASVWRRYDQMPQFPTGLLVIGDAQCSLNPIYGQGMTMAALQALALRDCLYSGAAGLARRFFPSAAQPIAQVWARNRSNERMPLTTGRRSLRKRLRSQIIKSTLVAASEDPVVTESLLRVAHLIGQPNQLNNPKLLLRIAIVSARHLFVKLRDPQAEPSPQLAHAVAPT